MTTTATTSSVSQAAIVAILLGLMSPAAAEVPQRNGLTSHSPWLAPVGHRQPMRADASQGQEVLSAWERQQVALDAELDRKLIICRGC